MEQLITLILSSLVLIVNGFLFFVIKDIKTDIRELRLGYTSALSEVTNLKVEIANLKGVIEVLRAELKALKEKYIK